MPDHWTVHRWWVPAEHEARFAALWRALAEMLVEEDMMKSVSLFADEDDHRVRWTMLRWSSQTARRAWRADARHRSVEDGMIAICERTRVHRMTTVLTVGRR
jgi:heme-degrading monooxygenase HmoA